jgi:hypothetical protein
MPLTDTNTTIDWLPWTVEAFARAGREGKPVLLSITAAWCRACHEMDRTTYLDPDVVALIRDRFVPIRIDTDRRPDINDRYNLGGWPTTAFLTADGDVITGGTFVPVDRMAGVLARVLLLFSLATYAYRMPARGALRRPAEVRVCPGRDPEVFGLDPPLVHIRLASATRGPALGAVVPGRSHQQPLEQPHFHLCSELCACWCSRPRIYWRQ